MSRSTCTYSRLPCLVEPGSSSRAKCREALRQLPTSQEALPDRGACLLFEGSPDNAMDRRPQPRVIKTAGYVWAMDLLPLAITTSCT